MMIDSYKKLMKYTSFLRIYSLVFYRNKNEFRNVSELLGEIDIDLVKGSKFKLLNDKIYFRSKKLGLHRLIISLAPVINIEFTVVGLFFITIVLSTSYKSNYVNEDYYRLRYMDINSLNLSPVLHFWKFGYYEGRSPQAKFAAKLPNLHLDQIVTLISSTASPSELEELLFYNFEATIRRSLS
jgi:hypothetical protein